MAFPMIVNNVVV